MSPPNEAFPSFEASWLLTARWQDPRLAFSARERGTDRLVFLGEEAAEKITEIWWPDLSVRNEDGEETIDGHTLVIRADGSAEYERIFEGRFRVQFDLRAFPFDVQELYVELESLAWDERDVVLEGIEDRFEVERPGELQDWTVGDLSWEIRRGSHPRASQPFSQLWVRVPASRRPGFYLGKVMLPLLLIIAFTWTTFWMTGEPAGSRMQRGFIALLSIVAFTQVIAQHLPRISYVTLLDAVLYVSFAATGLTLVQIIATHRADQRGDRERAVRLDRISRWAFPLGFLVVMLVLVAAYVPR